MLSYCLRGARRRQGASPRARWPGLRRAGSGGWFCRAKWPDPASTKQRDFLRPDPFSIQRQEDGIPFRRDAWRSNTGGLRASLVPSDPRAPLTLHPHYSDERFREPQTVYCATGMQRHLSHPDASMGLPGLSYAYEDRLWQEDADKWRRAVETANVSGEPKNSAYWLSALLTSYNGKPCMVEHVIAGVNPMNGHWWWAAGWREAPCPAL